MTPPAKVTGPNMYKVTQGGSVIEFGIDQITVNTKKKGPVVVTADWFSQQRLSRVTIGKPGPKPKTKPKKFQIEIDYSKVSAAIKKIGNRKLSDAQFRGLLEYVKADLIPLKK